MKSPFRTVVVAVFIATPLASFAQSSTPKTLAEVRAELVQIEQAGYSPGAADNTTYPADIQAAEARVETQNLKNSTAQLGSPDSSGVGGTGSGSSASGAVKPISPNDGTSPIYFGH
jgi:hypothetical protein